MSGPLVSAAGNVEVPAWLVLVEKGYAVQPSGQGWLAERDGLRCRADSVIELLGLVCMLEARGADWAASDDDIDAFLLEFGGQGA